MKAAGDRDAAIMEGAVALLGPEASIRWSVYPRITFRGVAFEVDAIRQGTAVSVERDYKRTYRTAEELAQTIRTRRDGRVRREAKERKAMEAARATRLVREAAGREAMEALRARVGELAEHATSWSGKNYDIKQQGLLLAGLTLDQATILLPALHAAGVLKSVQKDEE